MTIPLFIILLVIAGMWNITDAWFSLSIYIQKMEKGINQNWHDHLIRVVRLLFGILLIYLAYLFGSNFC